MTDKEIKEYIELYRKSLLKVEELGELKVQMRNMERAVEDCEWRNVKLGLWKTICGKYDDSDLLNCYGDIFFITEKEDDYYIGKRVLWNLELSKESYEIHEIVETDSDGNYDFTDYEIKLYKE